MRKSTRQWERRASTMSGWVLPVLPFLDVGTEVKWATGGVQLRGWSVPALCCSANTEVVIAKWLVVPKTYFVPFRHFHKVQYQLTSVEMFRPHPVHIRCYPDR